MLTPLTQKFFNWGAVENSACYIAIGVAALSGYFVLMLVQKFLKTEDRTLLLSGCVGVTISMSTAIFTWPLGYYGANWLLPVFAAQIGMGVFFLESLIRAVNSITDPYDSFRLDRLLDLIIFRIFRINPPTQIYRDRNPRPDLPAIRTGRPTPSISIMFSSRSRVFRE